jgi:hypothetical protein
MGVAAAVRPINVETFDFHGREVSATRDIPCEFCRPQYDVPEPRFKPAISFSAGGEESGLTVSAHIAICADHLRELAQKAEELAPEPWSEEDHKRLVDDMNRKKS